MTSERKEYTTKKKKNEKIFKKKYSSSNHISVRIKIYQNIIIKGRHTRKIQGEIIIKKKNWKKNMKKMT
jgi:hypothetical protein